MNTRKCTRKARWSPLEIIIVSAVAICFLIVIVELFASLFTD